jgi:hypothetical protein
MDLTCCALRPRATPHNRAQNVRSCNGTRGRKCRLQSARPARTRPVRVSWRRVSFRSFFVFEIDAETPWTIDEVYPRSRTSLLKSRSEPHSHTNCPARLQRNTVLTPLTSHPAQPSRHHSNSEPTGTASPLTSPHASHIRGVPGHDHAPAQTRASKSCRAFLAKRVTNADAQLQLVTQAPTPGRPVARPRRRPLAHPIAQPAAPAPSYRRHGSAGGVLCWLHDGEFHAVVPFAICLCRLLSCRRRLHDGKLTVLLAQRALEALSSVRDVAAEAAAGERRAGHVGLGHLVRVPGTRGSTGW